MVEFLTTTGLAYSIEKIIKNAKSEIVIVSPYIKMSRNYHERLIDAEKRNIKVTIIFGKEELTADQEKLLDDLNKLELYFCDNLHAKCYMNESTALISSMNLYEYSQVNNREMGILIDKNKEPNTYQEIGVEIESIKKASDRLKKSNNPMFNQRKQNNGNCIRCGAKILLNPEAPLCKDCFYEWNKFGNPFYEEKYCHICGKPEITSMEKPVCYSCYKARF